MPVKNKSAVRAKARPIRSAVAMGAYIWPPAALRTGSSTLTSTIPAQLYLLRDSPTAAGFVLAPAVVASKLTFGISCNLAIRWADLPDLA